MSERNTAIVLAAGQGKRMHSKVQKQFLEIQGYPVLYYSLRCFQESPLIQDIILVTGEESISYCKEEIVQKYGFTKVSAVIPGGKERYDSVYAGLCECRDCEYVLIHDGARPFVTEEILKRGLQKVKETGACVIATLSLHVTVTDSRLASNAVVNSLFDGTTHRTIYPLLNARSDPQYTPT